MKKYMLGLYGPEDSKYLCLAARRAQAAGIETAWVAGPTPGCAAYVADTEAGWPMWDLSREEDVDCICHDGLSCACICGCFVCSAGMERDGACGRCAFWAVVTPCRGCGVRWNGWDIRSRSVRAGAASDGWVWRRRCGDLRRAAFGTAGRPSEGRGGSEWGAGGVGRSG